MNDCMYICVCMSVCYDQVIENKTQMTTRVYLYTCLIGQKLVVGVVLRKMMPHNQRIACLELDFIPLLSMHAYNIPSLEACLVHVSIDMCVYACVILYGLVNITVSQSTSYCTSFSHPHSLSS